MTKKELELLRPGDKVVFLPHVYVEDDGKIWTVTSTYLQYTEEPRFTVKQVLAMSDENLNKYKNWEPKFMGGSVVLNMSRSEYKSVFGEKRKDWRIRREPVFDYRQLKVVQGRYPMGEP